MRRRDFMAALGGAAAMPLVARAQQAERMRRVGVLMNVPASDPDARATIAAFQQGLQETGWVPGRNLQIDIRWRGGEVARLRQDAAELVKVRSDVLVAGLGPPTPILHQATRTIPIVVAQAVDPVGGGFVDNLARPGGNVTGFIQFEYGLAGKWLDLLKEMAPQVSRVGVIRELE